MEKLDIAFIERCAMGVNWSEKLQNIANVKSGVMDGFEVLIRI